jgi:hypothetical protein
MRLIVFLTIFAIGLIIKNNNWSNLLTKHKHKRDQRKMYGCNCEYDRHDWNGHRWFDGYSWYE